MEYYQKYVIPTCPRKDGCTCLIEWTKRGRLDSQLRDKSDVPWWINQNNSTGSHFVSPDYKVHVSCRKKNLSHFPKLPYNTYTLDLTGNKLNDSSFDILDPNKHRYNYVDHLTLDNNQLTLTLDNNQLTSLLEIPLSIHFSIRKNNITSISYEVSKKLSDSAYLKLGKNPWLCSCLGGSPTPRKSFILKAVDLQDVYCGPQSENKEFANRKISELNEDVLCPPEGEVEELLLQFLCCILALLIIAVLSKLIYDSVVYRRRGQLPWLAMKLP